MLLFNSTFAFNVTFRCLRFGMKQLQLPCKARTFETITTRHLSKQECIDWIHSGLKMCFLCNRRYRNSVSRLYRDVHKTLTAGCTFRNVATLFTNSTDIIYDMSFQRIHNISEETSVQMYSMNTSTLPQGLFWIFLGFTSRHWKHPWNWIFNIQGEARKRIKLCTPTHTAHFYSGCSTWQQWLTPCSIHVWCPVKEKKSDTLTLLQLTRGCQVIHQNTPPAAKDRALADVAKSLLHFVPTTNFLSRNNLQREISISKVWCSRMSNVKAKAEKGFYNSYKS